MSGKQKQIFSNCCANVLKQEKSVHIIEHNMDNIFEKRVKNE